MHLIKSEHALTTEESLSKSIFERIFEFAPDAIFLVDTKGLISRSNPRAEQMFGFTQQELVGQPIEILIPERFRKAHPTHRSQYTAHPHSRPMGVGLELHGLRKDGTEFPVDIMLSPIETAEGRIILAFVRDVTEKMKALEAQQTSERQLHSLVESVKDHAIFMLDPEGKVATWNSGAERIKGYKTEEIVGQHFSRFYTSQDVERDKPAQELRTATTLGRLEDEGWRIRKDGSRFWANVVITAIRDNHGQLLGFAKVTRDFTDRKKAADALLLQLSNALISNVDIRRLLSAISAGIQAVVPHDCAVLALHDPESDMLRIQLLETGEIQPRMLEAITPAERSSASKAFTSAAPLLLDNIDTSSFDGESLALLKTVGIESGCWLPLASKEHMIGTLVVASRGRSAFSQRELDLLCHIASQVASAVDNALAFRHIAELSEQLKREKQYLEDELNTEHQFTDIIGQSDALKRVLKQVETVAPTDATVLVLGETGTGKELIARSIHRLSHRRERTFIKLNCAAIPSGLLESELFGHEKGAFTSAVSQKIGRLELANGGTLFLDEIGDLPLELQPKLLRAIQEREIERLGGTKTIPVDVRLIAATNRNLEKMVATREFRSDLYYRLKVFPILNPLLRDRREDIPLLVRYFVHKHSRSLGKTILQIPDEIMHALTRWNWPGNIRELENFLERAVILSKGPILYVPLAELEQPGSTEEASAGTTLESNEREHILKVLRETKGAIAGPEGAAAKLGLKRTTLNSKLKKLGIKRQDHI